VNAIRDASRDACGRIGYADLEDELDEEAPAPPSARQRAADAGAIGDFLEAKLSKMILT
jgi:hypothetical protein